MDNLKHFVDGQSIMRVAPHLELTEGIPSAHYFYRVLDSAVYFHFIGHVDDESHRFFANEAKVMIANDNLTRAKMALSHLERLMRIKFTEDEIAA